jgi:hypothetical protein
VGGNEESRRADAEAAQRGDAEASESGKSVTPARTIASGDRDDSPACSCHACCDES